MSKCSSATCTEPRLLLRLNSQINMTSTAFSRTSSMVAAALRHNVAEDSSERCSDGWKDPIWRMAQHRPDNTDDPVRLWERAAVDHLINPWASWAERELSH
nr:hypothetical protein CFP56_21868 [Quercus suber]